MGIDWQSRRDGFEHRTDKPTDRPINWKYWASLPALKQWEACALSVNVNPDNLKARRMVMPGMPVFLPESFPSRAVELEFNRRLTMFNRHAEGNHLAVVRPQWFAGWCLHVGLENLPPELVAMATPEPKAAPVATPEPPAAPVPPAGASVVTHSTKVRRDTLTPVIELAQSQCRSPQDTAEVWAALLVLAEKKHAPLIGATEDGLQYLNKGSADIFRRNSLGKRLAR